MPPTAPPDFTIPHDGWRQAIVQGETLYLPRGISFVNGLWRVTVKNSQEYEKTLARAWKNLYRRRSKSLGARLPAAHGPKKRIETGVIGLHLQKYRRGKAIYVAVIVNQATLNGHRGVPIAHTRDSKLTQSWLDENMRLGAATRWHYLKLRENGKPERPVKPSDVPRKTVPKNPVQKVCYFEVMAWLLDIE